MSDGWGSQTCAPDDCDDDDDLDGDDDDDVHDDDDDNDNDNDDDGNDDEYAKVMLVVDLSSKGEKKFTQSVSMYPNFQLKRAFWNRVNSMLKRN